MFVIAEMISYLDLERGPQHVRRQTGEQTVRARQLDPLTAICSRELVHERSEIVLRRQRSRDDLRTRCG